MKRQSLAGKHAAAEPRQLGRPQDADQDQAACFMWEVGALPLLSLLTHPVQLGQDERAPAVKRCQVEVLRGVIVRPPQHCIGRL